ncbi:MAG: hypothetical protein KC449_21160, partial [Anaerolineales bacterium]|nr:hypothetical protein [Anaerolineales bacterium]
MTSINTSLQTPEVPIVERGNRDTWRILWRAFGYLRPYRNLVIGTYATMIIIGVLSLIIPQFIRLIIDRG